MKTFSLLILLTLMLVHVPMQAQKPGDYFECVVVSVKDSKIIITCDTPNDEQMCKLPKYKNDPDCLHLTLVVPFANWSEFTEWQNAPMASYAEVPRKQALPQVKQVFKARLNSEGNFELLASCEERARKAAEAYCGANHYCRPPLAVLSPAGCGEPHSAFISKLLQ